MNKSRKSFRVLLMMVLFCCLSCGKQQVKELEIKNEASSKIKNIDFPKDLLFGKGHLYNVENPYKNKKINSGYYHSIFDIFNNRMSTKKNDVYKAFTSSDSKIGIYYTHQFDLDNAGQCNDCNPFLDCYYFDGRYAVLTQEDAYKRIILDIDSDICFLVDYDEEQNGNIRNVIYLDEDLNPTFFINQDDEKLSFFEISDRKKRRIILAEFETKKNLKLESLNYSDVIKIHKLFSEKKFKIISSIYDDNLPYYFFP